MTRSNILARTGLITLLAFSTLISDGCVLPFTAGNTSGVGIIIPRLRRKKINLALELTSEPTGADIYYIPVSKDEIGLGAADLPFERYSYAGKTPLERTLNFTLPLFGGSKDPTKTSWNPWSVMVIARNEGYSDLSCCFGTASFRIRDASGIDREYFYQPKEGYDFFLNHPEVDILNLTQNIKFELHRSN
jgi:hypothetical protein